jgi:hypothetical protein
VVFLQISDSQVARITGISHWHMAEACYFKNYSVYPAPWEFSSEGSGK